MTIFKTHWPAWSPLPLHPPHVLYHHSIRLWLRHRWSLMGYQRMMRAWAICTDGCWVLNLNLRLRQAGLDIDQLLSGLYFDLWRGHQMRRCCLRLRRGGNVLFLKRRGTVERRCRRSDRRWKWKRWWDRGRRIDNWNHGDDSKGHLRRWERRWWVGRRVMRLLTVSIFTPGDMVGSDWLGWSHNFHTPGLDLPVDELLLFALIIIWKRKTEKNQWGDKVKHQMSQKWQERKKSKRQVHKVDIWSLFTCKKTHGWLSNSLFPSKLSSHYFFKSCTSWNI